MDSFLPVRFAFVLCFDGSSGRREMMHSAHRPQDCSFVKSFAHLFPLLLHIIGRQHYRLYTIKQIPSLKTLDYTKITKSEREKAERLANSAAGAALESDVQGEGKNAKTKTFVPGEGESAQESFVISFTPEQKEQIRQMVANASSPADIEAIEASVSRGIFPSFATGSLKRPAEEDNGNGQSAKKAKVDDNGE
jgi:hypothetical protein